MRWTWLARETGVLVRTAKSCGPDSLWVGVKFALRRAGDGDKANPDRRGEHEATVKTIAQGRPECLR